MINSTINGITRNFAKSVILCIYISLLIPEHKILGLLIQAISSWSSTTGMHVGSEREHIVGIRFTLIKVNANGNGDSHKKWTCTHDCVCHCQWEAYAHAWSTQWNSHTFFHGIVMVSVWILLFHIFISSMFVVISKPSISSMVIAFIAIVKWFACIADSHDEHETLHQFFPFCAVLML